MVLFKKNDKPTYDLSNLTMMIVEDSSYIQTLMISMLKVFGVGDIMVCSGGDEAIDLLKVTQARKKSRFVTDVDIIITDWLMPAGSGEKLVKWIRGHEEDSIRFLPIIVCSAYTTEKVVELARDFGANETLVKPISGVGLASRICNVIEQKRPFISAPNYFGPDRRRQAFPIKGPDRRVMKSEEIKVTHDKSAG